MSLNESLAGILVLERRKIGQHLPAIAVIAILELVHVGLADLARILVVLGAELFFDAVAWTFWLAVAVRFISVQASGEDWVGIRVNS